MTSLDHIVSQYTSTRQTSVRMTKEMKKRLDAISREIYGPRGVTRWVEDALESFTSRPDAVLLVGAGEANEGFDDVKILRLTVVAEAYLRDMVGKVLRLDPLVHNAKSQVLRAAFAHQIKRHEKREAALKGVKSRRPASKKDQVKLLKLDEKPRLGRRPSKTPASSSVGGASDSGDKA